MGAADDGSERVDDGPDGEALVGRDPGLGGGAGSGDGRAGRQRMAGGYREVERLPQQGDGRHPRRPWLRVPEPVGQDGRPAPERYP